jgi:hypothetical protein
MDLNKIKNILNNTINESYQLNFQLALEKANIKYRQKYIIPFSKAYLSGSEIYNKIGDDLLVFLNNNSDWYYFMKDCYLKKELV